MPLPSDADAISLRQRRRQQLPLEMSALPIVHKNVKIAHHIHTVTSQLLVDKEVAEGADAREYRGKDIRPPRTLLLGSNRPQRGEGGRHIQMHWDDWVDVQERRGQLPPSHSLLPSFHLPSWWAKVIISVLVDVELSGGGGMIVYY